MKMTNLFAGALSLLLISGAAQAAEKYTLDMRDKIFTGRDNTIHLKQKLNNSYRGLNLDYAKIQRIDIVAKSRNGQGRVEFLDNGRVIDAARIRGNRFTFNSNMGATFDTVSLRRLSASGGTWQLRLIGDVKVRRISVFLEESDFSVRMPELSFLRVGSESAAKVPDLDTVSFAPKRASAVLIRCTSGNMNVDRVTVHFVNGATLSIPQLMGNLDAGEQAVAHIPNNELVDRVSLMVRSTNLIGSRADYEVLIGTNNRRAE
jgi:hypothetical protein